MERRAQKPFTKQAGRYPMLLELRRRQAAGLIIFALAILIFSLLRAGASAFPPGWWRLW